MRIQRVAIKNYRCLRDVDIRFDEVTTFIGPNGVGKSAVLRALDWFFNGTAQSLTDEDVWAGADRKQISVEVQFCDLTDLDRAALGKYAAGGAQTVRLWRRWEDGTAKLSGHAQAYPAFEDVRRLERAGERTAAYRALRDARPELGLPAARGAQAAGEAMSAWERANPEELVVTELTADGHFFGFAGQAKMTGLFDYVFVSADLRAVEEGRDAKGSVIGRIMDQAVDRTQAEKDLLELQAVFNDDRGKIHAEHFEAQLDELSDELTREVEQLTRGRRLRVSSHIPELRVPQAQFQVSVEDGTASTRVDQQGHGFQRALLITALRVLAERNAARRAARCFWPSRNPSCSNTRCRPERSPPSCERSQHRPSAAFRSPTRHTAPTFSKPKGSTRSGGSAAPSRTAPPPAVFTPPHKTMSVTGSEQPSTNGTCRSSSLAPT